MTSPPRPPPANLDPTSVRALELLVTGITTATAARTLAVSPRHLYTHLSAARRTLGATTPYLLGVLAVRSGIVPPATVIDHARAGRGGDSWMAPTPDQHELLRLLATGSTYQQAATSLGASYRTVQRRVRELAQANGVHRLLPAGALFEALGWHQPHTSTATA